MQSQFTARAHGLFPTVFSPIARMIQSFRRNSPESPADDDRLLRHELERMQALSPHLLADIGIDCAADAPIDDLMRQANRLKNL